MKASMTTNTPLEAGSSAITAKNKELVSLMFEMGRLLKREISRESVLMPSFLHAETLRFIQESGKKGISPTMSDIAEYLKIAPPSATALVNGFVKEDVIERVADPSDRRIVRLSLSKKGTQFLEETRIQREKAFAQVLEPLSVEESELLARLLTIITRNRD